MNGYARVKHFRPSRPRKTNPLLYALLAGRGARSRGRPPTITLGDLVRSAGVSPTKRPLGRPKLVRPIDDREFIEEWERFKKEQGIRKDQDAANVWVEAVAASRGGRPPEWKALRVHRWQSLLSRARKRAGLLLRNKVSRKRQKEYPGLHDLEKAWRNLHEIR